MTNTTTKTKLREYTQWQAHVLKTLWNIRDFGADDAKGMGVLPGRNRKVAADKLRKLGLVERTERGTFVEPIYRLTQAGLDEAERLFSRKMVAFEGGPSQ